MSNKTGQSPPSREGVMLEIPPTHQFVLNFKQNTQGIYDRFSTFVWRLDDRARYTDILYTICRMIRDDNFLKFRFWVKFVIFINQQEMQNVAHDTSEESSSPRIYPRRNFSISVIACIKYAAYSMSHSIWLIWYESWYHF